VFVCSGVVIGFGSPADINVTRVAEGMVAMVPVRILMGCVGVSVNVSVTILNLNPGERSKCQYNIHCSSLGFEIFLSV